MDVGVLIARVVFGLLLAAHGSQKLFGWFGGPGMSGAAAFFEGLGFRPGRLFVRWPLSRNAEAAFSSCSGLFSLPRPRRSSPS